MGFNDASGRVEIITGVDTFDCHRLQPRNQNEVDKERREGPLYRIIASFSMMDQAEAKVTSLHRVHGDKVRIEVITAKREIEAITRGEFRVKLDGKWVDDYGDESKEAESIETEKR